MADGSHLLNRVQVSYPQAMLIAGIAGLIIGFISAIPVAGPLSAVIFSRGMSGKYSQGRWIAVGGGAVEAMYVFAAFWGFHHYLADLTLAIKISNGLAAALLLFLGVYFFRSKKMRHPEGKESKSKNEHAAFLIGAGMSAANPSVIATWAVIASGIHSSGIFKLTELNSGAFAVGVWVGISAWFTIMLVILAKHRDMLKGKLLDRILKGFGIFLFALSVYMIYRLFQAK